MAALRFADRINSKCNTGFIFGFRIFTKANCNNSFCKIKSLKTKKLKKNLNYDKRKLKFEN